MRGTTRPDFDPIAFLREIVATPSADPPGGELDVAVATHRTLTDLGIDATLDEFLPGRANVIGRLKGRGARPPLVLSAHLDTVPVGAEPWSFDPFSGDLVDGRVRGRGASDMKGAVAAFVAAIAEIAARDAPPPGDVILALTAGESANALGARHLVAQGFQSEIGAFLCGEPSSLDLIIAEKAVLWVAATARGRTGHVSGDPGLNAIDAIMEFLERLPELALDVPDHALLSAPSAAVGRIEGGTAVNITPDRCRAEIDLRFGPGLTPEAALDALRQLAPEAVDLSIIDFKPAVVRSPDCPFVACTADAIRARTGRVPAVLGVPYYSDAAVLLDGLDVPFVIAGPGDLGQSGQPDESVSAEAVLAMVDIYADIIAGWQG